MILLTETAHVGLQPSLGWDRRVESSRMRSSPWAAGPLRTVVPDFRQRTRRSRARFDDSARIARIERGGVIPTEELTSGYGPERCNSVLDRPVLGRIGSLFTGRLRKG